MNKKEIRALVLELVNSEDFQVATEMAIQQYVSAYLAKLFGQEFMRMRGLTFEDLDNDLDETVN